MFLQLSVILFTGGGSASVYAGIPHPPQHTPRTRHPPRADTPQSRHHPPDQAPLRTDNPPAQCMLGDTVHKRAVCILLECNLVSLSQQICICLFHIVLYFFLSCFTDIPEKTLNPNHSDEQDSTFENTTHFESTQSVTDYFKSTSLANEYETQGIQDVTTELLSQTQLTTTSLPEIPKISINCDSIYSFCDKDKNLTQVPKNISADTKELDLSGNVIENITEDLFTHLQNLTTVSLKNSAVTRISPDAFVNLTQITSLQLAGNSMTSLPDGVFRNQKKLETLDLGQNPLQEIKAKTLMGLKSMTGLRLSGSALQTIDPTTFTQTTSLTVLQVDINQINNFKTIIYNKDSYSKPQHPPKIVVERSNTILCHENMCWLKKKKMKES